MTQICDKMMDISNVNFFNVTYTCITICTMLNPCTEASLQKSSHDVIMTVRTCIPYIDNSTLLNTVVEKIILRYMCFSPDRLRPLYALSSQGW